MAAHTGARPRSPHRTSEHVVAIIINALFLYAAPNLIAWGFPFVTDRWYEVVWALMISLQVTILGHALLLAFDPIWLRRVVDVVQTAVALPVAYLMWQIYPFDFGGFDPIARFATLIAIFGVGIALIVTTILAIVEIGRACLRAE